MDHISSVTLGATLMFAVNPAIHSPFSFLKNASFTSMALVENLQTVTSTKLDKTVVKFADHGTRINGYVVV